MILSKRERYIVIATVGVLLLLGIDQYLLSPLLQRRSDAAAQTTAVSTELADADTTVNVRGLRASNRWKEMTDAGLQVSPSETESFLLKELQGFAARSGLQLGALRPERSDKLKHFQQITFRATATGRMEAVRRFLYAIEHAKFPIRVSDLTVTTRKDGQDELSVNLGITTIHQPVEQPKPAEASGGGGNSQAAVNNLPEGRR
jgi:Tfp pilus assembly protein PilO